MFILSILLILLSSYFFLSIICSKEKNCAGFLYFLLLAFSQIILSFEVLSLFKGISKTNFLICNIFFLLLSTIIFIIKKSSLYKFSIERNKIISALRRDKVLGLFSVCFVIYLISELILTLFYPVKFGDALAYYFTRCTSWVQAGSLNHFITPDTRELIMPFNMDLLYLWKLLFTKSEIGTGIFSYISYIALIYVIYNFLKEINIPVRQRLWTIFTISSFALLTIEIYTPCSDLFIGALILSSIYLYLKAVKYNSRKDLYFSSLALMLSAGTKVTAFITFPAVLITFAVINNLYKKEDTKKFLLHFILFSIINFIIFSSYNYILNFIQFSNPLTTIPQKEIHKFRGGFKGYISNLIKYCFVIFDTSGMPFLNTFNGFITYIQSLVLSIFGLTDKSFTSNYFNPYYYFNKDMFITNTGLGVMGILVFLPSLIKSVKRLIKHKTKQSIILGTLTICLFLNIIIFSRAMVFSGYNIRYFLTFAIIAFPICAYSYIQKNKIFKYFIYLILFIYLVIIPIQQLINNKFIIAEYKTIEEIKLYEYIKEQNNKEIGLIISIDNKPNYYIEKLKLNGFKADKILLENIEAYNLSKYNYIISGKDLIISNNIVNFKDIIKYPDLYVSRCSYADFNQNIITTSEENPPAMEACNIPYEYFKEKGFIPIEKKEFPSYIIWENSLKNKYHS